MFFYLEELRSHLMDQIVRNKLKTLAALNYGEAHQRRSSCTESRYLIIIIKVCVLIVMLHILLCLIANLILLLIVLLKLLLDQIY